VAVVIRPYGDLTPDALAPLVAESEWAGWKFVCRLADDLRSGANRFDLPGECLVVAVSGDAVVGACGLNADPYAGDPSVGRVRRLYVSAAHRGSGVGRRLVGAVVAAAVGRFRRLRVRTESPVAGRLYERLGFVPVVGVADCTHALDLTDAEPHAAPDPARWVSFGNV
jgi:GNAT superfamily N-acetyltransferase